MSTQVTLKANGLNFSPNNLSLPQGSLLVANNVVISRDDTIESRRGFREYSEGIGSTLVRIKQLIEYKGRLLAHYTNKLAFDTTELNSTGKSIFDDFSGTYTDAESGIRMKSIEANKNLYFTTGEGIKKISARTADDLSTLAGFIKNAGAVKALDFSAILDIEQGQVSGFLPSDTTVAYRVVWGYKDLNDNLILGVPSDRVVVYNYLSDQMAMDLNAFLVILDTIDQSTSMITDGDYASSFYTPVNSSGSVLLNNVLQLAVKIDQDILYADQGGSAPLDMDTIQIATNECTITFDAAMTPESYFSPGDSIMLSDFGTTFAVVNGAQTITSVDNMTRTITFNVTSADIGSAAVDSAATIYSNNYRNITATGDEVYSDPLDDLVLSIPPTSDQLRLINNTLFRIIERVKAELPGVIPTALQTAYITPYTMTERANVLLTITVPSTIDSDYFVQVYRTRNFTADGVQTLGDSGGIPVVADDEMRLVYEAFPTSAEIAAEEIDFLDNYPEELIQNNANLYTNPETGAGILKANYPPPFAKDINTFKNVTFYANTQTAYQIPILQLLGVSNIASGDKVTISNGIHSNTYTFVSGAQEITDITFTMIGLSAGEYMTLYSAEDEKIYDLYYVIDGVGSAPSNPGHTPVAVNILSTFTNNELATRSMDVINSLVYNFSAVENTLPKIRVTNVDEGKTTNYSAATSPFTMTVIQNGDGEDDASQQVLLSSLISAAQAIDETARSFVRVINKQTSSPVNAYYISGDNTPPGQINLQSKNLTDPRFYIIGSDDGIGLSFNPEISPENTNIDQITAAAATVIRTSSAHGLKNGDQIVITDSNSTPSIDGLYTVTVTDTTHFTIPVTVVTPGTSAVWTKATDIEYATNEIRANRIYYSKLNQPDATPILNYLDVGAEDKAILRIFPLRDSLFVFKEDGLYRISGEVEPFVVSLFDSSCVLIAPDSVDVSNNEIYCWTLKGIIKVNETGADNVISRPIDTEISKLGSSSYTNFRTLTWGVGYDSDNSYTVYTNSNIDDEYATVGFTFNNMTNTWTNVVRTQTCGIVLDTDDKLYMGSGVFNYIDQERKDFSRTDYSDKDFDLVLGGGSLFTNDTILKFTSVDEIDEGDVILQNQDLTIYLYNKILYQLDNDPTVQDDNYFASLAAFPGDEMRLKIEALATKLDLDPGLFGDYYDRIDTKAGTILSNSASDPTAITTSGAHELVNGRMIAITGTQSPASDPVLLGEYVVSDTGTYGSSTTFEIDVDVNTGGGTGLSYSTASTEGSFEDIKACFNIIVSRLNADPGATYSTYKTVSVVTPFEAVVVNVDRRTNKVTMNMPLQWIPGPVTVYKSIPKEVVYAPEAMGDTALSKQVREATIMLESKAITNFTVAFSSDLIPEFFEIPFNGSGNGIFGNSNASGFGSGYFGGMGNAAPFRTIIPRKTQRCRYILVKVNHSVAREKFILNGVTLTGEISKSTRAYR
jgi:hypothetical protein